MELFLVYGEIMDSSSGRNHAKLDVSKRHVASVKPAKPVYA